MSNNNGGLYGITNSSRRGKDLWGKNQFNSSFPASLACYMRDNGIKPIYLTLNKNLEVEANELSFDEVFGTDKPNSEISFEFESKFTPYQQFAYDDIKGIDLVLKDGEKYLRALEIKLTVLPDNTTSSHSEELWGSELVIRPASTSYCALGIAHSCQDQFAHIRSIFEDVCEGIQHWDNQQDILYRAKRIVDCLNDFQSQYYQRQQPFLMHPIWKTKGKSPILDENAFDIFIWSDFALCRTFIDRSSNNNGKSKISRHMRSSARLARMLYELSSRGKTNIERIYTEMGYGHQSDKEFALSGRITRDYMQHPRRTNPILPPEVLKEIILNGGQKNLSPERRFDQSVYYTAEYLFE